MSEASGPSWTPTREQIESSRIVAFARWLVDEDLASFADVTDFHELQAWSARHPQEFWSAVARFFAVVFHHEPDAVWESRKMPGTAWFPGSRLNFAEHLLRTDSDRDAIVMIVEDGTTTTISHRELRRQVRILAGRLRALGVEQGDRVVAYLPNSIEGVVGFLATAWIGATWSQAGLDLAARSAADRLSQLDPKVLICGGGYFFKGLVHDRRNEARELCGLLPTVQHTIAVSTAGLSLSRTGGDDVLEWEDALTGAEPVDVVPVPFDHPLWVLFTSGTTGKPKGIVHGHGGALLEQLASPGFHLDLGPDDVFFWFTSPNWMMWNAQVCGLLHGASILLYDGNPVDPSADRLWRIAAEHGVTVFGTSPGYLKASEQSGCEPGRDLDLSAMRIVAVTGSILPPAANRWVREHIGPTVQVGSTSGGTDVVGIFVSSNPILPVYDGEISGVALGVSLQVWDDAGRQVPPGVSGEMVITEPMPSMPIGFWNDPHDTAYRETYFSKFPGIWRHGDAITMTERGTIVIHGRTDATLNRNGVRLGSAEIYDAVESLPDIVDTLVVGVERPDGGYWMPLFVVVSSSTVDEEEIGRRIRDRLRERTSPRHVPDEVIVVPALPHTRTGKKLEVPIKKLLAGRQTGEVISRSAVDDPSALEWFVDFASKRAATAGDDDVEPTDDYRNWRVYSEQRMSRILSAALETFSDNGYHGTTIRQLAERAGLSVPGVYHHYKSKQDILFDLMMVVIDELIERSRHALAEVDDDPRAQFDVLVEALLLFHMNRQKGAVLSANELRKLDADHRARYTARREEQQRMLDVVVSDGVTHGVFHTPYPVDASRAIASLCLGVASWYHTDGELPDDEFLKRYRTIAQSIVGLA